MKNKISEYIFEYRFGICCNILTCVFKCSIKIIYACSIKTLPMTSQMPAPEFTTSLTGIQFSHFQQNRHTVHGTYIQVTSCYFMTKRVWRSDFDRRFLKGLTWDEFTEVHYKSMEIVGSKNMKLSSDWLGSCVGLQERSEAGLAGSACDIHLR